MTIIQKIFLLLLILFLAVIPLWLYFAVPNLLKLSKDHNVTINLNAISSTRHAFETEWSDDAIVKANISEIVESFNDSTQVVYSKFSKTTLDGHPLWNVENRYTLDRKSRLVIKKNGIAESESYYLFPLHVQKQNYLMWLTANNPVFNFKYKGAEVISGLNVYHFSTEETDVDDTEGFSWLKLVPEVYNVFSVQTIDLWVEPISGKVVNLTDKGTSYYSNKINGEKVYAMQQWNNSFKEDTVLQQVRIAQNEKQLIILYELWIPILFGIIALALLLALFASRKVAISKPIRKTAIS